MDAMTGIALVLMLFLTFVMVPITLILGVIRIVYFLQKRDSKKVSKYFKWSLVLFLVIFFAAMLSISLSVQ